MDQSADNALTEVALALAMAFFAIMVLAMVSMAVPTSGRSTAETPDKAVTATLVSARKNPVQQPPPPVKDRYVVFYKGQFLNRQLAPMQAQALAAARARVVVALSPEISLRESIAIKALIPAEHTVVTTLSPAWLKRLQELYP